MGVGNSSLQAEMHTTDEGRRKKYDDFLMGHIEKVRQVIVYYPL